MRTVCLWWCACAAIGCALAGAPRAAWSNESAAAAPAEQPLHERIDALVEAVHVGPVAERTDDSEFLRRAWLDLAGIIPPAGEARRFLQDASPDKRALLIDRLLESTQFSRHMAHVFDAMLMERRERYVNSLDWHKYLFQSFVERKPIDQLAREIFVADGADPKTPSAAKFFLDRECEPNVLTRDIGRIFFGMDLQCAQCHDHPIVDDYYQEDYYGLFAFVSRVSLFTDAKDPAKPAYYVAERAEGEVNYQSVFTGDSDEAVRPRPPKQPALVEPVVAKGEEYIVAPAANVRHIPKYSRRARLAESIADGRSEAFNRNMANRLWAHMIGRGLVHPLDLHHSGNPPTNPELLALLSDELVRMKYDVRDFLRQIALSRTYERSSRPPSPSDWAPGQAGAQLAAAAARSDELAAQAAASTAAAEVASDQLGAIRERRKAARARKAELAAAAAKADETAAALRPPLAEAEAKLAALETGLAAVVEAAAKSRAAATALADDQALADAAAAIESRQTAITADLDALRTTANTRRAELDAAVAAATAARQSAETASAEFAAVDGEFTACDERTQAAAAAATRDRIAAEAAARRAKDLEFVAEFERRAAAAFAARVTLDDLEADEMSDEAKVAGAREHYESEWSEARRAWDAIVDKLHGQCALAAIKPLSPEQFGWSLLQASLLLKDSQSAAPRELVKPIEEALAKKLAAAAQTDEGEASAEGETPAGSAATAESAAADGAPASEPAAAAWLPIVAPATAEAIERHVYEKLRASVGVFTTLYGSAVGQTQDAFQASINQALFFANSDHMRSWAAHGAGRLAAIADGNALAEELYLGLMTRFPTAAERADLAAHLEGREDRTVAIEEMVWALMASNEFRFNH